MNIDEVMRSIFISFVMLSLSMLFLKSRCDQRKQSLKITELINSKEFPTPISLERQQEDIDNWTKRETPESQVMLEMIEKTHKRCPVMNSPTNISVCIQYPPLNKGFIVSLCCKRCVKLIQESFKKGDGKYSIKKQNNMDVLFVNDKPTQVLSSCNVENMQKIIDLIGTKTLD
jgi:hypothetical protein